MRLLLFGILLGILSGLFPAVHSNTIVSLILKYEPISNLDSAMLIVSMASAHVIFSFIPAVFLFIPDETVLCVLPAHRMVKEGKGMAAIHIMASSALIASLLSLLLSPLALLALPFLYRMVRPHLFKVLILLSIIMLLSERKTSYAILVFTLSGILGWLVLHTLSLPQPLFPSFTGMFALSGAILSLKSGEKAVRQKRTAVKLSRFLPYVMLGMTLGFLSDLLPAVGSPAQMTLFPFLFIKGEPDIFLSVISSVASSHSIFSILSLHSIGKTRTGAVVGVMQLLGSITPNQLFLLLTLSFISTAISTALIFALSPLLSIMPEYIDGRINAIIALIVLFLIFLSHGLMGMLVAMVCCSIGLLPPLLGIRRTHLMGFLLLPTIVQLWVN